MSYTHRFGLKTITALVVLFWTIAPLGKAIGEGSQEKPVVTEAPNLRDSVKKAASEDTLVRQRPMKGGPSGTTRKRDRAPASSAPVRIEPNVGPNTGTANTSPEKAVRWQH